MRSRLLLLTGIIALTGAMPAYAARQINLPCMQQAVQRRESNYLTSFDAYNVTIRNARQNRMSAYQSAWSTEDKKQRTDIIRAADKTYRETEKYARKLSRDAEKTIRDIFRTEERACKS